MVVLTSSLRPARPMRLRTAAFTPTCTAVASSAANSEEARRDRLLVEKLEQESNEIEVANYECETWR